MPNSNSEHLRFPAIDGLTAQGDSSDRDLSSDFGPVLRGGIDHQIGLTERLVAAFGDERHPSYIKHGFATCWRSTRLSITKPRLPPR